MGNPAPSVSQNALPAAPAPADLAACEQKAKTDLNLVESEPATSVQVVDVNTFVCCQQFLIRIVNFSDSSS